MTDAIKLNAIQLYRLHEIGWGKHRHENIAKASTKRLEELGLIEVRGRKVAASGRLVWGGDCHLTKAGEAYRDAHPR